MDNETVGDLVPAGTPTQIVTHRTKTDILSHWSSLPHEEGQVIVSTLNMVDPRNRILIQQAIAGESESLWDVCAKGPAEIEVQDIIAHYTEYESEETPGELRRGPMLTLIGPSGRWHTGSEYAFRALQVCALLGDLPPWEPPMRFRVQRALSRNKRDYQTLLCLGRTVV
jgi:hypothetical protein